MLQKECSEKTGCNAQKETRRKRMTVREATTMVQGASILENEILPVIEAYLAEHERELPYRHLREFRRLLDIGNELFYQLENDES
jgi:hypothetical protein